MTRSSPFLALGLLALLPGCAPIADTTAPPPMAAPAFQSDRISVVTTGSGPDVVLIHGLGSSRSVWQALVQAAPGYRYHLVQINGFAGVPAGGNSGDGPFIAPVAEEIARYIADTRLSAPAIVGHSMGGEMAMIVAARHPGLVSKVMVVDMLPFMPALAAPPGATADTIRPMAEGLRAKIASPAGKTMFPGIIGTMVTGTAPRQKAIADAMGSDQTIVARGMYDLYTTDLRPELGAIKVPMTVLYVRLPDSPVDTATMTRIYTSSFANAPQTKLVLIPDSRHFIMHDQPARFAAEMKAFLGG